MYSTQHLIVTISDCVTSYAFTIVLFMTILEYTCCKIFAIRHVMFCQQQTCTSCTYFSLSLSLFGFTGVQIQGLTLIRQALYRLSNTFSPLCCSYFLDRVLCFCSGPGSDCDTSNSPSSHSCDYKSKLPCLFLL
jgi:hypothetical protein